MWCRTEKWAWIRRLFVIRAWVCRRTRSRVVLVGRGVRLLVWIRLLVRIRARRCICIRRVRSRVVVLWSERLLLPRRTRVVRTCIGRRIVLLLERRLVVGARVGGHAGQLQRKHVVVERQSLSGRLSSVLNRSSWSQGGEQRWAKMKCEWTRGRRRSCCLCVLLLHSALTRSPKKARATIAVAKRGTNNKHLYLHLGHRCIQS